MHRLAKWEEKIYCPEDQAQNESEGAVSWQRIIGIHLPILLVNAESVGTPVARFGLPPEERPLLMGRPPKINSSNHLPLC